MTFYYQTPAAVTEDEQIFADKLARVIVDLIDKTESQIDAARCIGLDEAYVDRLIRDIKSIAYDQLEVSIAQIIATTLIII